tara:strand:+ start:850 stop:1026 length:177 start_codon:yes stop_codon:yes gene_type:complete
MEELKIVENIAKIHAVSRRHRLDARVDEIAKEKGMTVLEKARFKARAIDAIDRGDLIF